jgi:hypothetical protein
MVGGRAGASRRIVDPAARRGLNEVASHTGAGSVLAVWPPPRRPAPHLGRRRKRNALSGSKSLENECGSSRSTMTRHVTALPKIEPPEIGPPAPPAREVGGGPREGGQPQGPPPTEGTPPCGGRGGARLEAIQGRARSIAELVEISHQGFVHQCPVDAFGGGDKQFDDGCKPDQIIALGRVAEHSATAIPHASENNSSQIRILFRWTLTGRSKYDF